VTIYQQGQKVRDTASFTDINGNPVDPVNVSVSVQTPAFVTSDQTPSMVHDGVGTGTYHLDVDTAPLAGNYLVIWTAANPNVVYAHQFAARATAMQIVGLTEVKDHLNKSRTAVTDDNELLGFIDTAGDVVESIVGPVRPRSVTEYFDGGGCTVFLNEWPAISVTSVVETWWGGQSFTLAQETTLGVGSSTGYDFTYDPDTGGVTRRVNFFTGQFPAGTRNVKVTYLAGRSQPWKMSIRLAALEMIGHLWRNSQLGRGASRAQAGGDDLAVVAGLGYSVPNRVVELLAGDRKPPPVAVL
jgi:hypothetical protein